MYKMLNEGSESLAATIRIESAGHSHDTRNRNRLLPPFPRVEAIRRNYQYRFIDVWNSIPDEIRNSRNLRCFKTELSNKFLNEY